MCHGDMEMRDMRFRERVQVQTPYVPGVRGNGLFKG